MKGRITWKKGEPHYFIDGEEVGSMEFHAAFRPLTDDGVPGSSLVAWKRPIKSDALAVHPKQIEEARERDRRHGVSVDYTPDGRPILRDRDQRRRMMKSLGVHDNSGGYGDG